MTAILTVLGFATAPGSALGATASVTEVFGERFLTYEASPGEANDLDMSGPTTVPIGTVTLRDEGATVAAGFGCVQVDPNEVSCASITATSIWLGDVGDIFTLASGFAQVNAGPGADQLTLCLQACSARLNGDGGNDILIAGNGRNWLNGGPGADTLTTGSGRDEVRGGLGPDTISTGAGTDFVFPGGGDDSVDAGPGDDALFYFDAHAPIIANLRTGTATGEGTDTFVGFEDILGSEFGDRLYGDANANEFSGMGGNDLLVGRGGADDMNGGVANLPAKKGLDRLFGGPGRDKLRGLNGDDFLVGGPGIDRLEGGTGNDFISARDGAGEIVRGQEGFDRARVDVGLDNVGGVEFLVCPSGCR